MVSGRTLPQTIAAAEAVRGGMPYAEAVIKHGVTYETIRRQLRKMDVPPMRRGRKPRQSPQEPR